MIVIGAQRSSRIKLIAISFSAAVALVIIGVILISHLSFATNDPSKVTGFWSTGVDDSNNLLPTGANDPHWTLASITGSGSVCQTQFGGTDAVNAPAKVATGDDRHDIAPNQNRTNFGDRGASRVVNGIDYNTPGCYFPGAKANDPIGPNRGADNVITKGSTFTFKLTKGFNVDQCVDLSTMKISIQNFQADDDAQVVINGHIAVSFAQIRHDSISIGNSSDGTIGVASFDAGPMAQDGVTQLFKHGSNSLSIQIKSAWDATVLRIGSAPIVVTADCNLWGASATAKANVTTATPGDTITWTHTVTNNGPAATNTDIRTHYQNRLNDGTPGSAWLSDPANSGSTEGPDSHLPSGTGVGGYVPYTSTYVVKTSDVGKTICRVTSFTPTGLNNSAWTESNKACVKIGRKPVVNILGSDLIVGRAFSGLTVPASPAATVNTSQTVRVASPTAIPAPDSAFSGLWNTGVHVVNGIVKKITTANTPDPHWILEKVERPAGKTSQKTCQYIDTSTSTAQQKTAVPATNSSTPLYLRTVKEAADGSGAGQYQTGDPFITGNKQINNFTGTPAWAWNRTSPVATWIAMNQYGMDYNDTSCPDPTYPDGNTFANANIYTFKLKDGFTIDPNANVDLSTARIVVSGGADDDIQFIVNGHSLGDPQGLSWQTPGATAVSQTTGAGLFQNGHNDLELRVRSFYSHTGLLIDSIKITANQNVNTSTTYGSWVEYGIMAPPLSGGSSIQGIASGSAFASPSGLASSSVCDYSTLSFTNAGSSTCPASGVIGGYNSSQSIPDVASRFPGGANLGNNPTVDFSKKTYQGTYTGSGTIKVTGGGTKLKAGQWAVINAPNATVEIAGNVNYTDGTLHTLQDIPQLVIIAKNIIVDSNVTNIDSWLIAEGTDAIPGTIDTCRVTTLTAHTNPLSTSLCNQQLKVNGPVMAQKLYLNRTYGAEGSNPGDPAEVFDLRSDAYLWAYERSITSNHVQTDSTTELPPRF